MCDVMRIVQSFAPTYSFKNAMISCRASTSSPAVGSSRISSRARWLMAARTRAFAFMPVENSFSCFLSGRPNFAHISRKNASSNSRYIARRIAIASSSDSTSENIESDSATPSCSLSCGVSARASRPNTFTLPVVGFTSPRIALMVVLFPEPFFPMIPTTLLSGMSIEISSRKSPYSFTKCSNAIICQSRSSKKRRFNSFLARIIYHANPRMQVICRRLFRGKKGESPPGQGDSPVVFGRE